jgi:uncharacterized membrane protein
LLSVLRCGTIFGFFDAWIYSTLWGFNKIDPDAAITTMQAMNAAVRNAGFALAFFAASVVLLPALCWRMDAATDVLRCALPWRACSVALADWRWRTGVSGLALKMVINVPMNQALAVI